MGPHCLVVIEDCDRSVVLAPPEIESSSTEPPAPELVPLGGEAEPSEDPAALNCSQNMGASTIGTVPVGAEEKIEAGVTALTTKERAEPPFILPRSGGDEAAMAVGGTPPTSPEFLRALKATPKT